MVTLLQLLYLENDQIVSLILACSLTKMTLLTIWLLCFAFLVTVSLPVYANNLLVKTNIKALITQ